MSAPAPHFHLLAEAERHKRCGRWRFVLQTADGKPQLEAHDAEPDASGERLELLAIVRGLEALDGPSRVTLITGSSSVSKGLQYGLDEWRTNDWQWERHGEMVPVKNSDLWRRIDHALQFHDVDCRVWRIDRSHLRNHKDQSATENRPPSLRVAKMPQPAFPLSGKRYQSELVEHKSAENETAEAAADGFAPTTSHARRQKWLAMGRRIRESIGAARLRLAQFGTGILPRPWLE